MGDTWKKFVVAGQLALLAQGAGGCLSQAVIESGASTPEVLPLLALSVPLDLIGAAIASAGNSNGSSTSTPAPVAPYTGGPDPDDWVGQCRGPLRCEDNKHFVCEGPTGDCDCRCVITPVPACEPATPIDGSTLAKCQPPAGDDVAVL